MINVNLNERMQTAADLVLPGFAAADIGTDHGYIPIWLYQNGVCPHVIFADVAKGPLERAEKNARAAGLCDIDIRLGNGLEILKPGEAATVIIAGMGGELISDILGAVPEKTCSFKRFILQPRTRSPQLRKWLFEKGFSIAEEKLAKEGGRICEIIAAEPPQNGFAALPAIKEGAELDIKKERDFLIPPALLENKDPLLSEFLDIHIIRIKAVTDGLLKKSAADENELCYWQALLKELFELKEKL